MPVHSLDWINARSCSMSLAPMINEFNEPLGFPLGVIFTVNVNKIKYRYFTQSLWPLLNEAQCSCH